MSRDQTFSPRVLALLEDLREPESDDPTQWTPPEVLGLVVQYAYAVEALAHHADNSWSGSEGLAEEVLFARDLLEEWLAEFGEEALEDLLVDDFAAVPLPSESDGRLADLYRENAHVRAFVEGEYRRFRDELEPPRSARWWWLDGVCNESKVH